NAPANSAAFIYKNVKLDKTKSQLWLAAVSAPTPGSTGFGLPLLSLLNGASAPAADTKANIDAKTLLRRVYAAQSSDALLDSFWSSAGTQTYWDGTNAAWTTTYSTALKSLMPIQADDYYIVGLEIDGANSRWRLFSWNQSFRTAGTYDANQGSRLFAISDWVT